MHEHYTPEYDLALVDAYAHYQHARGWSSATVKRRRITLAALARDLHPTPLSAATPAQLEDWTSNPAHGPATRHAYRCDLRAFYAWAHKRGHVGANPAVGLEQVKIPKRLPRPVDPTIVRQVIDCCPDYDTRLMLAFAAMCGLRRSEIAGLTTGDLMLHSRPPVVMVRAGKGAKDRPVPMPAMLVAMLAAVRRRSGPLFTVSAVTVGRRVTAHLRACGIQATTHALRHSYGTEAARASGGNVTLVGRLMGHESVSTTQLYIGWNGGEAASVVEALYAS